MCSIYNLLNAILQLLFGQANGGEKKMPEKAEKQLTKHENLAGTLLIPPSSSQTHVSINLIHSEVQHFSALLFPIFCLSFLNGFSEIKACP